MRLLITQETDWLKRNPLQQHHLAEMLMLRGHDVRVIDHELLWKTLSRKELYSQREVFEDVFKIYPGAGITVIRPGIVKIRWLDYVSLIFSHSREIARQVREFGPDVIVGFGILNSYLGLKVAKRNHIPFVYHWLDILHWLIPFKPFQFLGKMIESRVLKLADRVIVVSDRLSDFVIGLGAPPKRVHILKPGISLRHFNPATSGTAVRSRYGLKDDDIILFFMGWLYNFSGVKEVALELAKSNNSRLRFLIVGDGDAFDDLKRIQKEHNLRRRVIMTGKQPYADIPAFIAAVDICLLPAYPGEKIMHDGLPAKMYEYMAMQKPVITTRLPGIMGEFGEDNGVVYVDRPEDVVAKAVELSSRGELRQLGLKARSFVAKYDWNNIVDEFERHLEGAIKEKRDGTAR